MHQALQFAQSGDVTNASLAARQALLANPSNLQACRLIGDLADRAGSFHALTWRKRLMDLEPTLSNRLLFAQCAFNRERPPFPATAKVLKEIGGAGASNVTYHSLSSQLALRLNQMSLAEEHLARAAELEPSNVLHQVNLLVFRLTSTNQVEAHLARSELEQLRTQREFTVPVLQSLIADSRAHQDLDRAEGLSAELIAQAGSTFADRLSQVALLWEKKSSRFPAALEMAKACAVTNVIAATSLCGWMNGVGLARDAVDWIRTLPSDFRSTPPLPIVLAESFAQQGDWRALETHAQERRWGDWEALRMAWRARAFERQEDRTGSRLQWQKAVRLASERPAMLLLLARLADDWGWQIETEELLWTLFNDFPGETWVPHMLERLYHLRGNTWGLQKLTSALLQRKPGDPVLENNLAMYSFLLKTDLAVAHATAQRLHRSDPTHPSFLSTYAFSLYLQGRTAEAADLIKSLKERHLEKLSIQAYYGIILAGAGDKEKAKVHLQHALDSLLLPEERALVREGLGMKPLEQ